MPQSHRPDELVTYYLLKTLFILLGYAFPNGAEIDRHLAMDDDQRSADLKSCPTIFGICASILSLGSRTRYRAVRNAKRLHEGQGSS